MIRFVDATLEPLLRESCGGLGVFGAKIYAQYQTYGVQSGIADFWLALDEKNVTAVISRLDGHLTVACAPGADTDELALFLRVSGVSTQGTLPLIGQIGARLGRHAESSWVMEFPRTSIPPVENAEGAIAPAKNLRSVYELLCMGEPLFRKKVPYDAWLVETSHKQRHGLADICLLTERQAPVCTAGILFKGQDKAIIASVATHPEYRGRGFARRLVSHLAGESLRQGLSPCLLTNDDSLMSFYQKCGFETSGRWGRISF